MTPGYHTMPFDNQPVEPDFSTVPQPSMLQSFDGLDPKNYLLHQPGIGHHSD
jgi:hypothetical protein